MYICKFLEEHKHLANCQKIQKANATLICKRLEAWPSLKCVCVCVCVYI